MKFGALMIVAGYLVLVVSFGWVGVVVAAIHIGSLFLFGPRR